MSHRLRVLVLTVVHRPDDARILHRQITFLQDQGFAVTYAAPWTATGVTPPQGLATHDLPRSTGRDRLAAVFAARELLRREGKNFDIVVLHDPELLLAVRFAGSVTLPAVVWDVHEDTAVALGDRDWVPRFLRGLLAGFVRRLERWAERHVHLVLAEEGYRSRFRRAHPVVRNYPWASQRPAPDALVAPTSPPRIVYVGRISQGRGVTTMVALGHALADEARVELAGPIDDDVRELVAAEAAAGSIIWHGFVPNNELGEFLAGASVGLSLLGNDPNYRVSMPSKVVEYLAHGIPVVATPLPTVVTLLEEEGGGILVPFDDLDATVEAVLQLVSDADMRAAHVAQGIAAASRRTWEVEGARLVTMLRTWSE